MFVLIDNLQPNEPCLINLDTVNAVSWKHGTLTFEFQDNLCVETETDKSEFIKIAKACNVIAEVE